MSLCHAPDNCICSTDAIGALGNRYRPISIAVAGQVRVGGGRSLQESGKERETESERSDEIDGPGLLLFISSTLRIAQLGPKTENHHHLFRYFFFDFLFFWASCKIN